MFVHVKLGWKGMDQLTRGSVWTIDFVCCVRAICWPFLEFLLLVVAALPRRKKNFYTEKIYCYGRSIDEAGLTKLKP